MQARNRSAIILIIIALIAFAAHWVVDDDICNPDTWHSATQVATKGPQKGQLLPWRPPQREGATFFATIFRGGGGTPAIFAMLGGQRYLVANILWNYSDVLFHEGKQYEMVYPMESTVTLNPGFVDAWSVYGWHLAWNLNADNSNPVLKAKYLQDGENIYVRAIEANPEFPRPYFDMAWLQLQRRGDIETARDYLEKVVYGDDLKDKYYTAADRKRLAEINKSDVGIPYDLELKWDSDIYARRLAYVYKLIAVLAKDDAAKRAENFEKAIATYKLCIKLHAKDTISKTNLDQIVAKMHDAQWLDTQYSQAIKIRTNFGMPSPDSEIYGDDTHSH